MTVGCAFFRNDATGERLGAVDLARRLNVSLNLLYEDDHGAPGWTGYRAADPPVAAFGQEAYELAPVGGVQQWALRDSTLPLATLKVQRIAALGAVFAGKVAAGCSVGGQVVDIDARGMADINSMLATANAVLMAAVAGQPTWPAGYARGWVARGGTRVPLPNPLAGIKFAAPVNGYYAALVQHEQDLEDAVNAAASLAALRAIDITAGWPTAA